MDYINAKEAAKIANRVKADEALKNACIADRFVKEDIMPRIVEETESGERFLKFEIAYDSDAYKLRTLIFEILRALDYYVGFRGSDTKIIIRW